MRKLKDEVVSAFEYVGEWGNGIEGEIDSLKGDLADLENTVQNIEWTDGSFLQNSSVAQGSGRSISNYLLCNSGDTVSYIAETSNN